MLDWLAAYNGPLFDACVCDPPYELGFMGKSWDSTGIAFQVETWRRVYDALKPGAHLIAFSGTRTYHRMACAIEDAGFEIRDQLAWAYGSGFPKSHDVSKAIDKAAGAVREVVSTRALTGKARVLKGGNYEGGYEGKTLTATYDTTAPATPDALKWQGWGTALKPAWEPICLARKPLAEKNIAANVLAHGTGAINVDACRVGIDELERAVIDARSGAGFGTIQCEHAGRCEGEKFKSHTAGRWPANLCHDGSEEVLAGFPESEGGGFPQKISATNAIAYRTSEERESRINLSDAGSAARFFYSAKAGPLDRIGTAHATVKPVDLMRWLCRLVTPQGGHILEPFAGSGTTGIAAMAEGFDCTMIELEAEHAADIARKLAFLRGEGGASVIEKHRARINRAKPESDGPLFGDAA
jgi:site-specific DNA-methyltransferase (adenine-specific)